MRVSSVKTSHKRFAAVLLAVFLLALAAFPLAVNAAEPEFYRTWEEAQPVYFPDSEKTNMNEVAYAIDKVLEAGRAYLESGDYDKAYECAQQAYYGYYEVCGFERQTMSLISGARKNEVEFIYRDLRKSVKNQSVEDYDAAADALRTDLYEDAAILAEISEPFVQKLNEDTAFADNYTRITGKTVAEIAAQAGVETKTGGAGSAIAVFTQAFVILLREGLEAILVIGGIIAYLIKSGNKRAVRAVYIGSVIAVGLSFLAAWLLDIIKGINSANGAKQELIEGITALLAVTVLFYVSNWMLSKSESEAWQSYIDNKVESSVSRGSLFALGFTAFLAVFREGAEVILFYQPLISDAQSGDGVGFMWLGVAVAVVALAAVFIAIRFFSVKLPLKPFFLATSILMSVMCIAFLGSGIKELIEGDFGITIYIQGVSELISKIPTNDVLDIFGIYPQSETIIPQFLLLCVIVVLYIMQFRRSKKLKAEIQKKKLEEQTSAQNS